MSNTPKKTLANFLGIWKYTHASADKFYKVEPQGDVYKITWGDGLSALDNPQKTKFVDAPEAFRRIRSKSRGGYTLEIAYDGKLPKTAKMEVADLHPVKPKKKNKPAIAPKKRFSFSDWLSERQ